MKIHGSPGGWMEMCALLTLLSSCAPTPAPERSARSHDTAEAQPEDDEETPTVGACTGIAGRVEAVEVEPTLVPTVLRLRWQTGSSGQAEVSFQRPDGTVVRIAPGAASTDNEVLLVGLPPKVDVPIVIRGETAEGAFCTELVGQTGPLDPRLPALEASSLDPAILDGGFVLVPLLKEMETWLLMLDGAGQVVWSRRMDFPGTTLNTVVFRMELSPDGRGVMVNTQAITWDAPGVLATIGWDGTLLDQVMVPGGHTDFTPLPGGGFAMLGWDVREYAGDRLLLGDTIIEVDAEGNQREVWNVFDHFEPRLDQHYPKGFLPEDPDVEDWSHVNGISYDPATDAFLVTMPMNESVIHIDRTTGEQTWMLSAFEGDFGPSGPETLVHQPHSVQAIPGGLLVFNRRDWARGTSCSEATEIALDHEAGTATRTWGYLTDSCLHVSFLGNAQRLSKGATLVSWSSLGRLTVGTAEGETAWEVSLPLGAAFGFASHGTLP